MTMKLTRLDRYEAVRRLLFSNANCYFTHHQISHFIGLKTTPYTRSIIMDIVHDEPNIHKIEVIANNGKMAWGYYYSENVIQEGLPCL